MKLSGKLLASAVIAALGGFLFGFDTVVISGAEKKIQSLWELNDAMHGLAMSAALWGTVLGALVGSIPTDRLGARGRCSGSASYTSSRPSGRRWRATSTRS